MKRKKTMAYRHRNIKLRVDYTEGTLEAERQLKLYLQQFEGK